MVSLCRAKKCVVYTIQKFRNLSAHAVRDGRGDVLPGLNFHNFKCKFTANRGPVQKNGFHSPVLVFYAESDSVNNSYRYTTSGEVHLCNIPIL